MDEEQQKVEDAFQAGFSGEAGGTPSTPAAPVAEVKEEPTQPVSTEAPTTEEQVDPVVFGGFRESEIKNLLAGAAKVGSLEEQLRKAHGKIGELNGRFQELHKAPANTLTPERMKEIETANPDVAAYVQARVGEIVPRTADAPQQPSAATPSTVDLQEALMDHLHDGWREKVGSQDFQLWIAAQPEEVRTTFNTTEKAKELSGVLGKYEAWMTSRDSRQSKGKERLENALTPTGTPGKPKTAPSANDAFLAGFKSVLG